MSSSATPTAPGTESTTSAPSTLPAGFDTAVVLGEREPRKGEGCFGFTLGADGILYSGAMGEYSHTIRITLVEVTPAPGTLPYFTPVTPTEIKEAEYTIELPEPESEALGWYIQRPGQGALGRVTRGVGMVKGSKRGVPMRMVRPFSRDDPRHLDHWPAGLF
ncbi:hypothetical protein BDW74DRAFT_183871 [Aspergillus multicolor]|uniref:uncharacterized protein n=1 Tax=Aspergillus multicolor TaxID=41759 RepID=UPI003CCDFCAA